MRSFFSRQEDETREIDFCDSNYFSFNTIEMIFWFFLIIIYHQAVQSISNPRLSSTRELVVCICLIDVLAWGKLITIF